MVNDTLALSNIEELEIVGNIIDISTIPLRRCTKLKKVTLPDRLSVIPSNMFCECSSLENVIIPRRVKKIEKNAFFNSGIKRINIPVTVEYIDKDAFDGCDNLTEFNISTYKF